MTPDGTHDARRGPAKRVVVTGGPGAGKTAILELARRNLCAHVHVMPEAARIVFGGGFPRGASTTARRCAQRAIYHVQHQLEEMAGDREDVVLALCDRGTVDGLAYWPGDPSAFFGEVGTTMSAELARYDAVLHLRTPTGDGYRNDAVRIETEREAHEIDARLLEVWSAHPRRIVIDSATDFLVKAERALAFLRDELPDPCRHERTRPAGDRAIATWGGSP